MAMVEDKEKWDLTYWTWEKFRDATLFGSDDSSSSSFGWNALLEADAIVGGVNWVSDFLCVKYKPHNDPILILYSSRGYGLGVAQMEYHFRQLLRLRKSTPIFPDPENLWIGGSKISVAELLVSVAVATNSLAPIVCPLHEQPSVSLVREVAEGKYGYVLKREWSGSAHHVYAPTKDVEGALANFKERIQFEKEILAEMSPTSPFWTPRWFKQPFIRDLVHRGELRSYIANGFLIGNCFTVPRDGSISDLDAWFSGRVKPLSRLEYMICSIGAFFLTHDYCLQSPGT